jgi:hypothetical protein
MKLPSELKCPIRITEAGSHSLNEFSGVDCKSFGASYAIYVGSIEVAIIKECNDGSWATSETRWGYNNYKSVHHAIKAILRRLLGKVGWVPDAVEIASFEKML